MLKQLKVKQYCTACVSKIQLYATAVSCLDEETVLVEVSENFSIWELTEKIKLRINKQVCKKHPKAKIDITYSFYHEQKITV